MTKKEFLIKSLSNGGLTSTQLIDMWISENGKKFLKRIDDYIKQEKEKIGETKFTRNQIRSELISIIDTNLETFKKDIKIEYVNTDNANFRILAETIYLLI